jgi:hypothetical protein
MFGHMKKEFKFGYYEATRAAIKESLKEKYGIIDADENGIVNSNIAGYILWMLDSVERMNVQSLDHALKAARWMGWILRVVEEDLKLWENDKSRDLVREDVGLGNDRPGTT